MIHANTTGVEADVVLVFISLILRDTEQHSVLHLQPELAMFVFQHSFVFLLEKQDENSLTVEQAVRITPVVAVRYLKMNGILP